MNLTLASLVSSTPISLAVLLVIAALWLLAIKAFLSLQGLVASDPSRESAPDLTTRRDERVSSMGVAAVIRSHRILPSILLFAFFATLELLDFTLGFSLALALGMALVWGSGEFDRSWKAAMAEVNPSARDAIEMPWWLAPLNWALIVFEWLGYFSLLGLGGHLLASAI